MCCFPATLSPGTFISEWNVTDPYWIRDETATSRDEARLPGKCDTKQPRRNLSRSASSASRLPALWRTARGLSVRSNAGACLRLRVKAWIGLKFGYCCGQECQTGMSARRDYSAWRRFRGGRVCVAEQKREQAPRTPNASRKSVAKFALEAPAYNSGNPGTSTRITFSKIFKKSVAFSTDYRHIDHLCPHFLM